MKHFYGNPAKHMHDKTPARQVRSARFEGINLNLHDVFQEGIKIYKVIDKYVDSAVCLHIGNRLPVC
jgi:hypothetical protein